MSSKTGILELPMTEKIRNLGDLRLKQLILYRDAARIVDKGAHKSLKEVHTSLKQQGHNCSYSALIKCLAAIEQAWPLSPPFICRDKDQPPSLATNGKTVLDETCQIVGEISASGDTGRPYVEQFVLATHTTFEVWLVPAIFGEFLKGQEIGKATIQLRVEEIRSAEEALQILKYGQARLLIEAHPEEYNAPGVRIHDLDFPLDWVAMIPRAVPSGNPEYAALLSEETKTLMPSHLRRLPVCCINDPDIAAQFRGEGPRCELPSIAGIASFVSKVSGCIGIIYDWRRPLQKLEEQFIFKKVRLNFPRLRLAVCEKSQGERSSLTEHFLNLINDHFGLDDKGHRVRKAKEEHLLRGR